MEDYSRYMLPIIQETTGTGAKEQINLLRASELCPFSRVFVFESSGPQMRCLDQQYQHRPGTCQNSHSQARSRAAESEALGQGGRHYISGGFRVSWRHVQIAELLL